LTAELENALDGARKALAAQVRSALKSESPPGIVRAGQHAVEWTVRTAGTAALDTFTAADWHGVAEVVVDIGIEPVPRLRDGLARLSAAVGRERIRLALPLITRSWEEDPLRARVGSLTGDGWMKWEATNLSAWTYLSARQTPGDGHTPLRYDLATDWSVYVLNRAAALQVMEMGATCFVVSPEAGFDDIRDLLAEFGKLATVIVYQDMPLFISETCPRANIKGRCDSENARCRDWRLDQVSSGGEEVSVISSNCRTVTVGRRPFSLVPFLNQLTAAAPSARNGRGRTGSPRLRVDLSWVPRPADEVRDIWRSLRQGKGPAGHSGNWKRGLV
jgi:hypothetical protein